jgi:hypothetical protein
MSTLGIGIRASILKPACASLTPVATSAQPTPQRLAAIREQLKLLADYL